MDLSLDVNSKKVAIGQSLQSPGATRDDPPMSSSLTVTVPVPSLEKGGGRH